MQRHPRKNQGIRVRHRRACQVGGKCDCKPTYEAEVYLAAAGGRGRTKLRKSFPTLAAAKGWRADATTQARKGTLRAPSQTTIREAWTTWLDGAQAGTIRNRSREAFAPSTLHGYAMSMDSRVLPAFGAARLSAVTRVDLQDYCDGLVAEGLSPSSVRNTVMPLRAIYRRASRRGEVAVNPTTDLDLPASRGTRDRIAPPEEAAALLAALDEADRPVWATAMYAGLRRGELMALRFEDIDLANGVLDITRAYDPRACVFKGPKSKAGVRKVPIAAVLREHVIAHRLRSGRATGLAFGPDADTVFDYWAVTRRASRVWRKAGMNPIGLHESRHTFASLMIAAGVNIKAISVFMGHSSIQITLDRYGHLMPGNEDVAAEQLDVYLAKELA